MIRRFLRFVVRLLLKPLTKAVMRKYQPRVVAITGSVGKTSTKECTVAMLAERYRVRGSPESYNNELGVPLTILGKDSGSSLKHWWGVFRHGLWLLVRRRDYPEVLVLEMGADHPGDLAYLTAIAPPDIAVVTNVGTTHLAFYDSLEAIAEEKSTLVGRLKPGGLAVLNFDDTRVRMMQTLAPGRVLYYGFTDESHLWVEQIKQGRGGLTATLHLREREGGPVKRWPLKTSVLGRHQLSSLLAAFGVAYTVGVVPEHALAVAMSFTPPPGRLRKLPGRGDLAILDDSYNASPPAVLAALDVLRDMPKPHRAVLGDMLELGKAEEPGHRMVGEVAGKFLDELVVVGDQAVLIAEAAKQVGLDPNRIWFAAEATQAAGLVGQYQHGGTVLVKGSQAMRLERTVKALLRDPRDTKHLVRQDWRN